MTVRDKQDYEKFKRGFALRLRLIVAAKELKLLHVANEAGIDDWSIYKYAHGENLPNAYKIARLAKVLGVSADYLLGIGGDAQ